MMDNLLFWNLRGIKSSVKRLKKVVQINNVSMLFLAEPIVDKGKIHDYRSKLGYDHCHANRNGKLWAFWNSHLVCQLRRDLWNDLPQFADKLDMPWLRGGILMPSLTGKKGKEETLRIEDRWRILAA
ncbi:Uncharacterized protein Adt_37749 [Abeliophyllum distichum]|uniref:Endonuclease/exonuclease/phosphatase n=1 Tax=Abeliophyllum distichum TaxID=126358 RepID=A0ABD1Q1X1_9LAMI